MGGKGLEILGAQPATNFDADNVARALVQYLVHSGGRFAFARCAEMRFRPSFEALDGEVKSATQCGPIFAASI
jgi:hypothetical protein